MAQRALPPGAIRRRAAFGLLDADGWTWATLKASFWFLFIVFMLGYIPNLAYYFTVQNTVEVGYNFISIVNWCPEDNRDLPCPAPVGATLPWQSSPPELALPSARAGSGVFQSGTNVYLIGGETADGATDEVLATVATLDGNFAPWNAGPALPEPRSDAAVGVYLGVPYVLGGLDASGQPTDTVFKGIVEGGELTGWELANGENQTEALTLPEPVSQAAVVVGTSGFALLGGLDASGEPVDHVQVAWIDLAPNSGGRLLEWQPLAGVPLPEPRAGAVAGMSGEFIYVIGGTGPEGPTDSVFRLELAGQGVATDETGEVQGWAIAPEESRLPEPRAQAVPFSSSGTIYVIGGLDGSGEPQASNLWIVPDTTTGDISDGWQHLDQSDLEAPVARAPVVGVASTAFIFGGETEGGLSDSTQRAGLAPRAPFFQLGIAGATIPALSIKGEIGQQLGYMNAMGVGTVNFIVLIILALFLSRPRAARRVISYLSRGRLKVPPEDEYSTSS
jgi:hypothetical protein